ncbi:MAG TPA: cytochrome c biogenesis protein CcdA [Spirochaetales bacterium]|nr:cytochrome c biogenesis protein CcdA [Spirochaetales bacterium]
MESSSSFLLTFLAGLVSFASPCVLPLLPSYLSFISGISYRDLQDGNIPLSRLFLRTLLFIAGFSFVFVALGVLLSSSFLLLGGIQKWIQRISGALVIVLGLNILFDFLNFLNREKRYQVAHPPKGWIGSFLIGMAFGAGWSPCIGPILGGILLLASQEGEVLRAAVLLLVYSLGLGAPFLAASLFFRPFLHGVKRFQKYVPLVRIGSGLLLILIGILMYAGRFQEITRWITQLGVALQQFEQTSSGFRKFGPLLLLLFLGSLPILWRWIHKKPLFTFWSTSLFLLFLTLGVAHAASWIDLVGIFSRWLLFQGI